MPSAQNQTVKIFLLLSQGFRHLVLDWQTVTIPTRNIRCPESAGRFESKNRILQNFVQCRSDVSASVRKRRTIVQHERFAAFVLFLHPGVYFQILPMVDANRLSLHSIRPHRKIRLGEIKSVLELFCLVHLRLWN